MPGIRSPLPSLWSEAASSFPSGPLRRQIEQIFDDFGRSVPSAFGTEGSFDFAPNTELEETEKEMIVRLELPGVDPENVEILVSDRTIAISGEKKSETEHTNSETYRSERSFGAFSRSFALPFTIDAGKVDARFDKGVLTVTIAKRAEAQAHASKIAIHG